MRRNVAASMSVRRRHEVGHEAWIAAFVEHDDMACHIGVVLSAASISPSSMR